MRISWGFGVVLVIGLLTYGFSDSIFSSSSENSQPASMPSREMRIRNVGGVPGVAPDDATIDDLSTWSKGNVNIVRDRNDRAQLEVAPRDTQDPIGIERGRDARNRPEKDSAERIGGSEARDRQHHAPESVRGLAPRDLLDDSEPPNEPGQEDANRGDNDRLTKGQLILKRVDVGTAAWESGIRPGDTLLSFDGYEISDSRSLARLYGTDPSPVAVTWKTPEGRVQSGVVPGSGLAGVGFQRR